jgi:exosortase/archaeosortase family protein
MAARGRVRRQDLFLGLVSLAALNAFAGVGIVTLRERGLAYSIFELFGISAIVWLALAAALALLLRRRGRPEAPRRWDWAVAVSVLLAALAPSGAAGAAGLTLLALYMIATTAAGSPERGAGFICLAMAGSLLWGRVVLAMFSGPLLGLDANLVGWLFGARQVANVVSFVDGSGRIVVAPGCSSWQGMSLALLFWVTVNEYYRVPFGWRAAGWCAAALAATIAVNVARMGAMILYPKHIAAIHHGWGWHFFMWTTLVAVVGICLWGARDAIRER